MQTAEQKSGVNISIFVHTSVQEEFSKMSPQGKSFSQKHQSEAKVYLEKEEKLCL